MVADLTIAWLFWFVIRWPLLRGQVIRMGLRLWREAIGLPQDFRYFLSQLRLESELASQRELRASGLGD